MTGQHPDQRSAIAALGRALNPEVLATVQAMFGPQQQRWVAAMPPLAVDQAYGTHQRQRLDLYVGDGETGRAVLLWVHGGGFLRGDKSSPDHPFNAHVGRWAARQGLIGAVMNYRLAPADTWPSGGEDVGSAVDWLRHNVCVYGGDPDRIVIMGTSAGAAHVAAHLRLRGDDPGVRGAILCSGLYGFTPLDERDQLYYGEPGLYPDRWSKEAVVETALPLLVAWAEFDPTRFQQEAIGLLAARLARHGTTPRAFCAIGHNHFSLASHLGSDDTRLADAVLAFVRDITTEERT